MKVKVTNQKEMANIFNKYGKPVDVTSNIGGYTPYENDSINDVFDEAMRLICWGAKSVTLIY